MQDDDHEIDEIDDDEIDDEPKTRVRAQPLTAKHVSLALNFRNSDQFRRHDGKCPGLYLQNSKYGTVSWILRYQIGGRARHMGLGSARSVTLQQARRLAGEARMQIQRGIDPIEAREQRLREIQQQAAARDREQKHTFGKAAEGWLQLQRRKWANAKYAKQVESQLKSHCAELWNRPVADIDTRMVVATLQPIWSKWPAAAQRMGRCIEAVLQRATFMEWRTGDNPARWKAHLEHAFVARRESEVEHIDMIPLNDVPAYASELHAKPGAAYRFLELLLYTNVRTHDIQHAKWQHLDMERREWKIPKASKIQKPVTVPLSDPAIAVIKQLPRVDGNDHLLPGRAGKPMDPRGVGKAMKRLRPDLSPHSSRSSFKTWAGDRTSFPPDIAEVAMLHNVGSKMERVYNRGQLLDQRRHLMNAWAAFCAAPATADVLTFKRA